MSISLEIERAIRDRADWYRNFLMAECPVTYKTGEIVSPKWSKPYETSATYFADFMGVTDAGYAIEYEVKLSRSDWRADLEKGKWRAMPSYVTRFIYVVPEALGIPEWVPEFAGVWHVHGTQAQYCAPGVLEWRTRVARVPRRLGKEKVPDSVLEDWRRSFYYRYWRQRIDLDRRIWQRREIERLTKLVERHTALHGELAEDLALPA